MRKIFKIMRHKSSRYQPHARSPHHNWFICLDCVCIIKREWESDALISWLSCAAYGIVYRARDKRNQRVVALKLVRILPAERHNGIPITALREISILRSLRHPNIVNVLDVAVGERTLDELYMVMEYCEQVCYFSSTSQQQSGWSVRKSVLRHHYIPEYYELCLYDA